MEESVDSRWNCKEMKQILLFFLNDLHMGFSFETIAKVPYITSGENWQKEIEELKDKLGNVSSTLTDSAQKLKEDYLQKLTVLEDQVNFGLDLARILHGLGLKLVYPGCEFEE